MLRFSKFQKIVLHFLVFIGFFLPEVFAQGKSESLPLASFLWNHRDPMRVGWDGNELFVQLKPYPDEGEYRLAFRVLREGHTHFRLIQNFLAQSHQNNNQYLTLPFSHLNASIQRDALKALFPRDTPDASGWKHRVIYEWESLPSLVNVFVEKEHREHSLLELATLGFSRNLSQNDIMKENNLEKGVEVVIPWKWIRQDLNLKPVALKPPLEVYEGPRGERFALYKLEAGETIYSHVVLRFTYFAGQQRITQAVGDLLALNELVNVHEIPSGTRIRIPLHWIRNDFQFHVPGVYQESESEKRSSSPPNSKNPGICAEYHSCIEEEVPPSPLQQSDHPSSSEDINHFPNLLSSFPNFDSSLR